MLYVTARDHREAYTAHRALTLDRAPDGGLFMPFRLPRLSREEIALLGERSFGQTVSVVLNLFFNTRLTSFDIEFCVGRSPVRAKLLSRRIAVAELWHNPGQGFDWTVRKLSELILSRYQIRTCSEWTYVAVRIAAMFGLYGQLVRGGLIKAGHQIDVSLVSGDFSGPMAVWYAREMGLPVGTVICCCNENNSLWELLHQGILRTNGVAAATDVPDVDVVIPASLERLVHACGGYSESARYLRACREGAAYAPNEVLLNRMRTGIHVSVVSTGRLADALRSVYATYAYLMEPYTVLAYTGLMDYRSRAGESGPALVLSDKNPAISCESVENALGIDREQLREILDQM